MVSDDLPPSILAKAFTLLGAFTPDRRVMSLSEIGRASGLPKSTVHRLLARLIEIGAIEHHRSGYRIGIMLLQLGATAPAMSMRDVALPHLSALHHRTALTTQFGVLRQFDVVILEKLARRNPPVSPSGLGSRHPANCSALGKALLAYEGLSDLGMFLPRPMRALTSASITDVDVLLNQLKDIRARGVAHEVQEARPGFASLAAPVTVMGSTVAAVSVTYPVGAPPARDLRTMVRDTALRIAGEVGGALGEGRARWFPHEIGSVPRPPARPVERAGSHRGLPVKR
jgi:DNA-binding IclR family transcriptional regulator